MGHAHTEKGPLYGNAWYQLMIICALKIMVILEPSQWNELMILSTRIDKFAIEIIHVDL